MKEIKLTQGKKALIDDNDFELISKYKWCAAKNKRCYYARTKVDGKSVSMHRLIMGITSSNIIIDHKDNDGLNNRRDNLRLATISQNNRNRKIKKNKKSSKYIGVYKVGNKYKSIISINNNRMFLGYFTNEEDASMEYNRIKNKIDINPPNEVLKAIKSYLE